MTADQGAVVDDLTISLPSALADELLDEQLVDEVIVWRGGADVVSLVTLAADVTSAVTAVVAARQSFATIARRLVRHVSDQAGQSPEVSITITVGQETTISTEPNDLPGITRLTVRVEAVLGDAFRAEKGGGQNSAPQRTARLN